MLTLALIVGPRLVLRSQISFTFGFVNLLTGHGLKASLIRRVICAIRASTWTQATTIPCGLVFGAPVRRANGRFVSSIPPNRLLVFNEIGSFVPPENYLALLESGEFKYVVVVFYQSQLARIQSLILTSRSSREPGPVVS